jgi:hypothetical protein
MQSDALQELRQGKNEPALLYLETVSSYSLNELNKQKSRDPDTPTPPHAAKAIKYLCANQPTIPRATSRLPSSIKDSCLSLTKTNAN